MAQYGQECIPEAIEIYLRSYKEKDVAIKVLKDMTEESTVEDFKKEFQILT